MNQSTWWHFGAAGGSDRAVWAEDVQLETVTCPLNPGHQRPGRRLSDLTVTMSNASQDDIVWTWQSDCLLSNRARQLFSESELTGYELRPATVVDEKTGARSRFWELVITGWAGVAPLESGVRLIDRCPVCGHRVYRCFDHPESLIQRSRWDGSDFFIVWPLPRFFFISWKTMQVLQGSGLREFRTVPVRELVCEGTLTPGSLSYWMPASRALILGADLGIT